MSEHLSIFTVCPLPFFSVHLAVCVCVCFFFSLSVLIYIWSFLSLPLALSLGLCRLSISRWVSLALSSLSESLVFSFSCSLSSSLCLLSLSFPLHTLSEPLCSASLFLSVFLHHLSLRPRQGLATIPCHPRALAMIYNRQPLGLIQSLLTHTGSG